MEVRLKGHPPICNTLSTLSAARKWAADAEAEIRVGRMLPRLEATKHTLTETIDRYVGGELEYIAARDQPNRVRHLKWWTKRLGAYTLADLTSTAISDARTTLERTRISPATSNRYLGSLSAVLGIASRDWGWVEQNPCSKVRRRKEGSRLRYLSEAERDRLLASCQESRNRLLYPLVMFALTTGARQGELMGLRWKDVDLVNARAVLDKTKNTDRRTLAFPGKAGELLREMNRTPHISGYLFAGPSGRPVFPREAWDHAIQRANVEDFKFHDLRHTAASYIAMSGATLAELAAFLGHRTLAMVSRYTHLSEGHSEAVAARMADKFLA